MHAHDNCWRCGRWFYGTGHNNEESMPRGMLGLCSWCWESLSSALLFIYVIFVLGMLVLGAITNIGGFAIPFFVSLFGLVVYGGIRFIQYLDNEGWFNFVDRIREKHLEPWERDK